MSQFTVEEIINLVPKQLVVDVMVNVFKFNKERKPVISGFRNTNLSVAPEKALKNCLIERIKDINWKDYDFGEEPTSLEGFEEEFNTKKYKCLTHILVAVVTGKNADIAIEAFEKLFMPKVDENPQEINRGDFTVCVADEKLELLAQITLLNAEIKGQNEVIEKLKQEKKEQRQKIKELEKKNKEQKEKIKEKDKRIEELEDLNEIIKSKDDEIARLDDKVKELRKNNEDLSGELNDLKKRDQLYTVVYGYNESFYKCKSGENVLQPDNVEQLINLGKQYKIKDIYYRESSLNKMQVINIKRNYAEILVEPLDLKTLISMGYLLKKGV